MVPANVSKTELLVPDCSCGMQTLMILTGRLPICLANGIFSGVPCLPWHVLLHPLHAFPLKSLAHVITSWQLELTQAASTILGQA